jgi:hypothetical protein
MAFSIGALNSRSRRVMVIVGITVFTVGVAVRMLVHVNRWAVNVLFLDQWDFWEPLFRKHWNYVDLFTFTIGHREGLGFVLTGMLAQLTGWNTRIECFMIAGVLILALLAAMALRRVLLGCWEWSDIIIPAMFLSLYMAEGLVETPNLSHGIMPLLLLMLLCLCWKIRREAVRYPLLLLVNFNATFTGFGMFLGVVTPAMLALEAFAFWRAGNRRAMIWAIAAFAGSLVSLALFCYHYHPSTAIPNFYVDRHVYRYLMFMATQIAYLVGMRNIGIPADTVGWAVMLIAAAVLAIHVRRLAAPRRGPMFPSHVIVMLIGFSLAFSAMCAYGRLPLGQFAGETPRYLPLLMGIVLGLYFHVASLPRGWIRTGLLALMVLVLVPAHLWFRQVDRLNAQTFADGKRNWKAAYFATGNVYAATDSTHFQIYPLFASGEDASPKLHQIMLDRRRHFEFQMKFLREHHLNLFLDAPASLPAQTTSPDSRARPGPPLTRPQAETQRSERAGDRGGNLNR